MAFDTLAAKGTGRWHKAMAFSLSLHVAIFVGAVTASSTRRDKPAATTIVVTVLPEAAAALPPAPAAAVAATASAPGRSGKPALRLRSDRPTNRLAPQPLAPASAGKQPAPTAVEAPAAVEATSLQGDVQVASARVGSGAALAGGVAPEAHGLEAGTAPRILPPAEGNGQLAIDPNEARYQPVIPPPLRKPGAKFAPLLKLCVKRDGSVGGVTVMRPSDPAVDPAIVEKILLFRFRPYLDHGRPIPFCFFREYRLSVEE
jgi:hypothetical protein